MTGRRVGAALALAVVPVVLLAGCGGDAPPVSTPSASAQGSTATQTADEAWAAYGALPQDLAAALDGALGDLGWTELDESPRVGEGDRTCVLDLARQRSTQVLLDVDDTDLSATRAALDPVLADYGFPPLSAVTVDGGGQTVVTSEHSGGGEVRLTTRSDTVIDVGAIPLDPADCTPGEYVPGDDHEERA